MYYVYQASRHDKIIGMAGHFFLKLCGRGTGVAKAWRGRGGELLVWQLPYLPYLLPMVYGGTPELYQNLKTSHMASLVFSEYAPPYVMAKKFLKSEFIFC